MKARYRLVDDPEIVVTAIEALGPLAVGWLWVAHPMLGNIGLHQSKIVLFEPAQGDPVRLYRGRTGRYLTNGLAIALCEDPPLIIDDAVVSGEGSEPNPRAALPSDDAVAGALAVIHSPLFVRARTEGDDASN